MKWLEIWGGGRMVCGARGCFGRCSFNNVAGVVEDAVDMIQRLHGNGILAIQQKGRDYCMNDFGTYVSAYLCDIFLLCCYCCSGATAFSTSPLLAVDVLVIVEKIVDSVECFFFE
ncbi:unnamed protein product [Trifolium pratense]|uniref:Uncharacterized protein n=1 Tax=Trifolium pratense TaxID=57577 RepID=A0ACB0LA78_TRIPR|nr:unnamed protein product [Trifolium pratense]